MPLDRFIQPWLWVLLWVGLPASSLRGETASLMRMYRVGGAYAAAVSFSPGGNAVSRSGDTPVVTLLDGFTRQDIPIPEEGHFRVSQSRSGQLWSIAQEGLLLYHSGRWTLHPLPEIRNDLVSNARPLRQISILPAEVNRVLVLLPDRLLEYEATARVLRPIKLARNTRLGQFNEMQEGADESIWISGTFGLAHVPGPLRRVGPDSEWTEYLLPNTNLVGNLQRPFEHPPGHLTLSANPLDSDARFIVEFARGAWSHLQIPDEKIRQAWGGWDGSAWGFSFNALFRYNPRVGSALLREPVFGRQYDVALEPGGAFWIAASEGLVRYAPFLWHAPPPLESITSPVHAILFDPAAPEKAWLSLPEGLAVVAGQESSLFPWPEEIEAIGALRGRLFLLPGGEVLIGTPGKPFVFSHADRRFTAIPDVPGLKINFLGETRSRSPVAWFEGSGSPLDLRSFDGTQFHPIKLPNTERPLGELSFFEEMAGGDSWIGGAEGLLHIRTNLTAEFFDSGQGLPAEHIYTVAEIGEGRIWCGTDSKLCELRGQRWHVILDTSSRVHSIVRMPNGAWVGTAAGLYRLLGDSWIFHGAGEGLSALPIFTLARSSSDRLWAGTGRGVSLYHPEADPDEPRTLPPTLVEPAQPSTVEPTMVSFQGQDRWDYTPSRDLLFSYKLDETPWTPFSNVNTRVFQNLSSGAHVLQVLAMDRNGNKARDPSQISFSVIVPWFKDPRLLVVSMFALALTFVLAGLAVNKHFQLKRSYAEVERIVTQRTQELERANRELLHSQKMRAIGTMAAGIAHDFNNILSIIKGSAQIIEGHVDNKDKIKTRVSRIQTVVEQGTTIVQALLGLGRMSEKDLAPCDIPALLEEIRRLLGDRFPESVRLRVEAETSLPPAVCARDVLQQMLLNLILNAVDAMGGEGLVRLAAHSSADLPEGLVLEPGPGGRYLVISVIDEGIGIAPENLPRIFEPFFTTKAFSSRRGTGLGLSMVYELAKGFGYGLAVQTRPGQGSSFSIILPLRAPGEPASHPAHSSSNGEENSS